MGGTGAYGRATLLFIMRATTLQQVIVEVWLYKHCFSILSDEFASFDREAKLQRVKELLLLAEEAFSSKLAGARGTYTLCIFVREDTLCVHSLQQSLFFVN